MLVLLHLFALFLLVLLGFYVFVNDPRSRANQTFAAFIAFLALWTTKDLIFWNFFDEYWGSELWATASFTIAFLMQCSLIVFAWVFPENARSPRKKAAVIFSPGLILIPAAFLGFLWTRIERNGDDFFIELTPIAYAFVVYVYFLFFYGSYVLFRKYREYKGTQRGQQLGAIIWAVALTGVLKTAANIILPYFGIYELLPFSSIFVLPGVLIYAYAISNFRLFSLQTALDQFRLFPLTYKVALSIASVAILSFILFQIPIAWWAFREGMDAEAWRRYIVFSVVSALVPNLLLLLLVVRIISRPLQRIAVAAVKVTNGEYGTEADLRKSNDEIGLLAETFNEMSRKMASDIDELKRMNEHLRRSDRLAAIGTLAAGVAHEVNNPLASVSSMVQMLEREARAKGDDIEQHRLILEQIERIKRVTRDLTDFARVRPAARTEIDINEVVRSSVRLASFDSDFRRFELQLELSDELPSVSADADQLQQVFLNLLLNAKDAMAGSGTIKIRSDAANESIRVSVSDTGSGISFQQKKQIFDPFFTTKPAGKGTGLGLAVCYGIVTAHGGSIDLESDETHGTTFTIRLPVLSSKEKSV
ncbi:ATP-binding protein [Leptolyngbya sp. 7M]|uniref:sensor histidine kinase n=1 Tax=Leptolyngbya sp. 7M TaxID=2812896 RepID=UPI001B8AA747|nr:ATP-binding protein [Leptolyngbya sp. 7M]QYO66910.1 HAMP domain-containing protein [Leptolyngbya sp. 7M]